MGSKVPLLNGGLIIWKNRIDLQVVFTTVLSPHHHKTVSTQNTAVCQTIITWFTSDLFSFSSFCWFIGSSKRFTAAPAALNIPTVALPTLTRKATMIGTTNTILMSLMMTLT